MGPIKQFMNKRRKERRSSMIIDTVDISEISESGTENENNEENDDENAISCNQFLLNSKNENNMSVNEKIAKYEQNDMTVNHKCSICYNSKNNEHENFTILNCNHIFHINCLVMYHYKTTDKFSVVDKELINNYECSICNESIEIEDISYIHSKFLKNTKDHLVKQQDNIIVLDKQMSKLKDEMRIIMEYKQRLEHQRERSKQITISINTFI